MPTFQVTPSRPLLTRCVLILVTSLLLTLTGLSLSSPKSASTISPSTARHSAAAAAAATPTPTPTLGTYSNASVVAGRNTAVTPSAAPTFAPNITAIASVGFTGTLAVNSATGAVIVTNAKPAGSYTITVKAKNGPNTASKTFTLTVNNPSACATTTFASRTDYNTGDVPFYVAVGDFNGDSKQDLAVANSGSDTVSILLGNSSGGFSPAPTPSVNVGSNPLYIGVGDFNGDGNQDLAVANFNSGDVTILLGDGSSGFSAASNSPITVGTGPSAIAVGDFNSDGKLDLVVVNSSSNNLTILLGNGNGTFSNTGSTVSIGNQAYDIAVSDFNADGKLDVAVTNFGDDNVTILLGNGSGGFTQAPGSPLNVGSNPANLAVGDFNKDGKPDLAVANSGIGKISILLGTGTGSFTQASGSPISVGSSPYSVAVGDFNGDGKLDLAAANYGDGNITLLLGNGSGGFSAAASSPTSVSGNPTFVVVGDFNNDGSQDLASANDIANTVSVLLNICAVNVAPTITPSNSLSRQQGDAGASATIATVSDTETAAGSLTVTATTVPTGITVSGITNTNGTITATIAADCTATVGSNTVVLTVTDGGGVTATANLTMDVTAGAVNISTPPATQTICAGSPVTFSVTATGSGLTYQWRKGGSPINGATASSYTINSTTTGDAGSYDVVITGACSTATSAAATLTVNTAPTVTTNPSNLTSITSGNVSFTAAASGSPSPTIQWQVSTNGGTTWNNISGATSTTLYLTSLKQTQNGYQYRAVFTNSCNTATTTAAILTVSHPLACTSPSFAAKADYSVGTLPQYVAVGDFNGDGKQDLVVANTTSNNVTILFGNGGTFNAASGSPMPVSIAVGSHPVYVVVGDFNGDGKQDLATANNTSNNVTILLGDGSGGFTEAAGSPISVGNGAFGLAVSDLNGDGKQDLAVTNYDANNVTILLGDGNGGFSPAASSPISVGSNPFDVVVGDFNADGKQDLAVSNYSSNNVTILIGDGAGGFTASGSAINVGSGPSFMAMGDFNGDGKQDLAVSNYNSNNVTILLGNGNGSFSQASGSPITVDSNPYSPVVGDFNGDGKADLAVTNYGASNVTLLLGNGSGGFTPASSSPLPVGASPINMAIGDFNSDGKQDLVTANSGDNKVSVLLGSCASANTAPTITAGSALTRQQGLAGTSATIATVSDTETAVGSLTVTATTVPTGITVSGITNTNGTITATVTAGCATTVGSNTVVLTVTDGGGVTATANLTVNVTSGAVNISNGPTAQTICAGSQVTFSVTATGSGLTYQWRKGGNPINGATASTYTINPATAGDAGSYDVVITGACTTATSAAATLTVNTAPVITSSPTNQSGAVAGSVNFTASASNSLSVQWQVSTDNGATWNNINGATSTTLSLTSLTLAQNGYQYRAIFTNSCNTATTTAATLTIAALTTTTALTSSVNPSVVGQNVTLTAAVTASSGTATGTVTFKDGSATLGTGSLNASGVATFSTSSLTIGSHTLTAVYGGDSNYPASTSSSVTQVVNQPSTTTAFTSTTNPSVFGQTVAFTATVTSSAGTPTGTVTFKDGSTTLGTATLSSGAATFLTAALSVGSHSITAVYAGDSTFTGSTSTATSQVVNKASTTGTLTSLGNPSVFGQTVNFTASVSAVSPGAGTPTGTLTFKDGSTTIGTATLSNGQASFSTSTLSIGSHSLTVVYGGDSNFNSNTSNAVTQVVKTADTNVTVISSASTSTYGQTVTFTATVIASAQSSGTPTGTVTFKDGSTTLGTGALDSNGQTTFSIANLSAGSHSITVVYGGDSSFGSNTSSAITQTINKATLTVTAENKTRAYGAANPAFTSTYSGFIGGETASALTGTPSLTTTATTNSSVGNYPITVAVGTLSANNYSFNFTNGTLTVTKGTLTVTAENKTRAYGTANPALTWTYSGFINGENASVLTGAPSLATTATESSNVGSYAITATVGTLTAPNYTLAFVDGTLTVSKAALTVTANNATRVYGATNPTLTGTLTGVQNNDNITATYSTSATSSSAVGSYTITPSLADPGNKLGNYNVTSNNATLTVSKASTTVNLTSSGSPSSPEQSVTLTATVSVVAPGAGTPTGAITFKDGATTLSTVAIDGLGQATLTTTFEAGDHSITAEYSGEANFNSSASAVFVQQQIGKASTTTTLTSSLNPAIYGQTITFNVTVTGSGGTPSGTVRFLNGQTLIGAANLNAGAASLTTSVLTAANYSLTAVYDGDSKFASSTSNVVAQVVNKSASSVAISSSGSPVASKQFVMLTAAVSVQVRGALAPSGNVMFRDGATLLGTVPLNSAGQAVLGLTTLTIGTHNITAEYSGDANYQGQTSTALTQSVDKEITSTTLTSSANPASFDQVVTLTATVLAREGNPTGSVEFYDGNQLLGIALISGHTASLPTNALGEGTRTLRAVYTGDDQFGASTSPTLTQITNTTCTYTLSTMSQSFKLTGGNGQITLSTKGGCAWQVVSNASWITVTSATEGSSASTVIRYTVAPLASGISRTSTLTIAGQTVTITQAKPIAVVSGASFTGEEIAPSQIVSAFGADMSTGAEGATALPLPTTLAGTQVKITDSKGVARLAPLFYVSPLQINYQVPKDIALGPATISIINGSEEVTGAGTLNIATVAPGIFTVNSNGQGVPAAVLQRVTADGTVTYAPIWQLDAAQGRYVPAPIDLGPDTDLLFLAMFGTGLRNRSSLAIVTAHIGDQEVEVLYAGAQGDFEGLDQVNIRIPRTLVGKGEMDLTLTVDGKIVNTLRINIR